jgi:hypothetical protein
LKTREKTKKKGNRNFLERKKNHISSNRPNPAQQSRARPCRLTGGLHLLAVVSFPHALSLPLTASGADLSAPISSECTSLTSLSHGPHSSARPPVYLPTLADRWVPSVGPFPSEPPVLHTMDAPTSARFPAQTHTPEPFLDPALVHSPFPALLHPQPSTLALSLTLCAWLGSSAVARRGLAPVLR